MSSFRKATKVSNGQPVATEGRKSGVKPWVNGLSLVSSGIRELDEVLGGGHVVGSLCLIHEDTYSNYSDTILLYSMAEAISQNHKTLLVVRDTNEAKALISALPFNMNKGSLSLDKKNTVRTAEEEEDDKKRHLKIAWQYGKYIKDTASTKSGSGSSTSYCSSYDLSNRLQADVLASNMPRVYCYAEKKEIKPNTNTGIFDFDESGETRDLEEVLDDIHDTVHSFLQVHSKTQANPVRVFIPHYDSILSNFSSRGENGALLGAKLLLRLKHLMQHEHNVESNSSEIPSTSNAHIPLTVFTSILPSAVPASFGNNCLQMFNSLADTVLGVESFAGQAASVPIEFRFFCGFFFVLKLQQIAAMAPHRSAACRFGLKRDRRKLHIEPLHLPPEDSRASKYQSETSLGVKQEKNPASALANSSSSTVLPKSMPKHQPDVSGSKLMPKVIKSVQQISIHGNDTSRHAPNVTGSSSDNSGALCASVLPSATGRSSRNLDF